MKISKQDFDKRKETCKSKAYEIKDVQKGIFSWETERVKTGNIFCGATLQARIECTYENCPIINMLGGKV